MSERTEVESVQATADRPYHKWLAATLRKAQGRICDETGDVVDVGAEVAMLRKWCDRTADELDRLRKELERNQYSRIHSCHANCRRIECVQGREIKRLRSIMEVLAYDLECELQERYGVGREAIHPALLPKYERDMEPVYQARAALAHKEPEQ